jgi:hypothetical protein
MVGCWESGGDFLRAENAPNIKSLGCRDNIDACVCNCQRPNSSDDTTHDDTNHKSRAFQMLEKDAAVLYQFMSAAIADPVVP